MDKGPANNNNTTTGINNTNRIPPKSTMFYEIKLRRRSGFKIRFCICLQLIQNIKGDSFDNSLLYEDRYSLNNYFPMVIFIFINAIALLSGFSLIGLHVREERRSEVLLGHRENQDRLARESALKIEEEEETFKDEWIEEKKDDDTVIEERLNIDVKNLIVDASGDEFEIAIAK